MILSKENTAVILKEMRAEGHNSRADYMQALEDRVVYLEEKRYELAVALQRCEEESNETK